MCVSVRPQAVFYKKKHPYPVVDARLDLDKQQELERQLLHRLRSKAVDHNPAPHEYAHQGDNFVICSCLTHFSIDEY